MSASGTLRRGVVTMDDRPVRADHSQAALRLGNSENTLLNGHGSQRVIGVKVIGGRPR
jgi:hypothetical protein